MTVIEATPATLTNQQLNTVFQYTVEAYKTFEKLAENLPNPLTANMFKQFAVDERATRDLIEMKIAATGTSRSKVTLANDLAFQDILEGDLSYRETTEFLIARERTMDRKLAEPGRGGSGYRLAYADAPIDGDEVVNVNGIRIALDNMSASRLDGAIIEYDDAEDRYLLDHPDAVSAVWCG